ncbi:hypothetical protein FRX31_029777 [Thalictrum thalictroides]|uniref:Reverse transcriptase zinc-binding domain-containing protein n=1 Tax=Thalictrum thalictroides TaxID=46969 RepID=A0A7J6V794_THATH|nr:hypothetical protein FRX31_029777 [Thalictrum thalictroides]
MGNYEWIADESYFVTMDPSGGSEARTKNDEADQNNNIDLERNLLISSTSGAYSEENLNVEVVSSNKHIINSIISSRIGSQPFSISFFYGSPYPNQKDLSWSFLEVAGETTSHPWMTIGDLNAVFSGFEKIGGLPFSEYENRVAIDTKQKLGLIDLGSSSPLQNHNQNSTNASWTWNSIRSTITNMVSQICWDIGDGTKIRIWEEPWIPSLPSHIPSPAFSSQPHNQQISHVNQLLLPNSSTWNISLLNQMFDPFSVQHIMNTNIRGTNHNDRLKWLGNKNGVFTVKSMYKFITSNIDHVQTDQKMNLKLWKVSAPPRAILFAWKYFHGGVPTRERLGRHLIIPTK